MLGVAVRIFASLSSRQIPVTCSSVFVSKNPINGGPRSDDSKFVTESPLNRIIIAGLIGSARGFGHDALASRQHEELSLTKDTETMAAIKNLSSEIAYEKYNHVRYPPEDLSKRTFTYFMLTGGRFVYASLLQLLVLSMSASKDILAMTSLEVDISGIEPGLTVMVKSCGKLVFIRRRMEDDIRLATSVVVGSIRDPL